MAIGGTVLFTPHLVPMTRGILATCYGEADGSGRSAGGPAGGLCGRAVRPRHRPASRDQVGHRLERRPDHRPLRRAHRARSRALGDRQSRQGRGGADDPVRQLDARPRRDGRADHHRSLPMSVTAAEGFVASGLHAGIKRRKFDMAMIATDDRRAGALRRRVHAEQVRRPAGRARPRDACRERRQGGGGHRQFGQRQCRHRRARLQGRRS